MRAMDRASTIAKRRSRAQSPTGRAAMIAASAVPYPGPREDRGRELEEGEGEERAQGGRDAEPALRGEGKGHDGNGHQGAEGDRVGEDQRGGRAPDDGGGEEPCRGSHQRQEDAAGKEHDPQARGLEKEENKENDGAPSEEARPAEEGRQELPAEDPSWGEERAPEQIELAGLPLARQRSRR